MLNPFGSLKQKLFPSYLGVDIGTNSIKIVEVKQGKQLPALVNYGLLQSNSHLVRNNDVIQSSNLKLSAEEVSRLLKLLIKKMKPSTTEVIASLPTFSIFMTVLDFPEMSSTDLEKSLTYQAREHIPLPISEVAIDWMSVGTRQDEQGFKYQQVLLISVPKELIQKYREIFKSAGLNLKSLEIESLSLARATVGNDSTPSLIVDIGSHSTNVTFSEKGQIKFNSQSDYAGASLTQALASSLNINPLRAEELKRQHGLLSSGPTQELSTIMTPFLDVIINEVKKAQYNYESQFPGTPKIERMVLSGGGANLAGIDRHFENEFGLPVIHANPFIKFEYPREIEPLVRELNPLFSVPLGLTLKEFS